MADNSKTGNFDMMKKEDGEWTLTKDGKEKARGSLKTVMAADLEDKKKDPKTVGKWEDAKDWIREKIGRPKGGGLSQKGATSGHVADAPPRKELDAKEGEGRFKRNPNWKQKGFKKQKKP